MQWTDDSNRGNALTGQFATPEWVARLLCSRLIQNPRTALDLGIGRGALALALKDRFPTTELIGVDKYSLPKTDRTIMRESGLHLMRRDISLPSFSLRFLAQFGEMNTIVSNPPFTYIENASAIRDLMEKQGFKCNRRAMKQRLDLLFLAHARKLLSQSGEMAFILPTSAFAMAKSIENLQVMSDHFGLEEIITLPANLFQNAEVDTAILIFRPGNRKQAIRKFAFYSALEESKLEFHGQYSAASIIEEMKVFTDSNKQSAAPNTLESIGSTVARGKHSSNSLLSKGVSHFHTTSFQHYPSAQVRFDQNELLTPQVQDAPALEGDILIARVGTRCLGNAAIVVSGRHYISDCVYRISTPAKHRRQIWEFISSEAGKNWQLSLARGACAKFITQQALLSTALPHPIL